ncbi:MAG: hypothetical protein M1812_001383 [Candelaria pacifica]|nr:MAG: hypothetical protein M1812_001383 [Candelaria pacifica]
MLLSLAALTVALSFAVAEPAEEIANLLDLVEDSNVIARNPHYGYYRHSSSSSVLVGPVKTVSSFSTPAGTATVTVVGPQGTDTAVVVGPTQTGTITIINKNSTDTFVIIPAPTGNVSVGTAATATVTIIGTQGTDSAVVVGPTQTGTLTFVAESTTGTIVISDIKPTGTGLGTGGLSFTTATGSTIKPVTTTTRRV